MSRRGRASNNVPGGSVLRFPVQKSLTDPVPTPSKPQLAPAPPSHVNPSSSSHRGTTISMSSNEYFNKKVRYKPSKHSSFTYESMDYGCTGSGMVTYSPHYEDPNHNNELEGTLSPSHIYTPTTTSSHNPVTTPTTTTPTPTEIQTGSGSNMDNEAYPVSDIEEIRKILGEMHAQSMNRTKSMLSSMMDEFRQQEKKRKAEFEEAEEKRVRRMISYEKENERRHKEKMDLMNELLQTSLSLLDYTRRTYERRNSPPTFVSNDSHQRDDDNKNKNNDDNR
ncbi:hypothetical protein INT45_006603 [Circinella minor]|uniref:Uncharacterized protein n=1 Tax=Circinella minor TaxID=1195481 RepID=A0A8H7VNW9_9FUNG|nr:hypothetical protein INT45_006603 [Circinella minor]